MRVHLERLTVRNNEVIETVDLYEPLLVVNQLSNLR